MDVEEWHEIQNLYAELDAPTEWLLEESLRIVTQKRRIISIAPEEIPQVQPQPISEEQITLAQAFWDRICEEYPEEAYRLALYFRDSKGKMNTKQQEAEKK